MPARYCATYERGEIDVIGARHLIRAGRAHLLTGLAESGWLEVKGGPYRLSHRALKNQGCG